MSACTKIKISKPNFRVKMGGDKITIKLTGNVGVGGGISTHNQLSGLENDDHPQYAKSDGSRGQFVQTIDAQDLISIFNTELI